VIADQRAHLAREAQCDDLQVAALLGDEGEAAAVAAGWQLAEAQGETFAFRLERSQAS
jgi:hypothetical protein